MTAKLFSGARWVLDRTRYGLVAATPPQRRQSRAAGLFCALYNKRGDDENETKSPPPLALTRE
jgi:hypothetical protein